MGMMIEKCPACGAQIREKCNAWAYGSPVKVCPKCKKEFLDKRFREVAVEGFDRRSVNPSFYLKGIFIFLAFTLLSVLVLVLMIKFTGTYRVKVLYCIGGGILGTIVCILLYIRVKFGFEEKEREKYMEESRKRLENKSYAEKLRAYGYNVPEQY